jgi:PAS domain S-box-containing protein
MEPSMSSELLLVQSEELFQCLFEQASLGIAVEDLAGKILLANPALCSLLGYQKSELCGMNCSQFANPEDSADDYAHFQKLRDGAIDHYSLEKRYVKKDGTRIWGRLNVSLLKNAEREFPLVFAFVEDITERKLAEEALGSVSRRLIEAQEQERARIARELHDDTNQRLAMLAIDVEQLKDDLPAQPVELRGRAEELWKRTLEIAKDVQALAHELHSPKLEYVGIIAAVKGFCEEFGEQQKAEIDFEGNDSLGPLPPDLSLCFFRVLQEALHNSAKHSGVRRFEVRLWATSEEIHLTVKDFGAGFDREAARLGRGLGLISMEERLKVLKGTLFIESQPERGTTVHARAPWPSESALTRPAA